MEHLQKNDQIEIKNVSVQFSKRSIQNNLILTRKSEIFLNDPFGTIPVLIKSIPIAQIDESNKIQQCPIPGKCTITLKIDSYLPNKKKNSILINCSTLNDKKVEVHVNIRRHDEGTKIEKGDLVKFGDVIHIQSKNDALALKINNNSKLFLLKKDGQLISFPKEVLQHRLTEKEIQDLETGKFTCPICFEIISAKKKKIYCASFVTKSSNDKEEKHKICAGCIKELAKSALTDAPLAFNGIGLPCCVPKCENVFLMSDFENYLNLKVYDALMGRMQRESILAANMDDLVICPDCSAMNFVDPCEIFYDCVCGTRRCRNCPRVYDKIHSENTCKQLNLRNIELELSKIVVRRCSKCGLQFTKKGGCNKIICRCGTKQCYLCRAVIPGYSHFCDCFFKDNELPCKKCKKTCALSYDADEYDKRQLEKIKKENDYKDYGPTSKLSFLKIFVAFFALILVFFVIVLFSKFVRTRRVSC
uniref:RING-type domain-containing protein n=1 Tax=Panagrolaimus sp. JU765 TaxID=591449 RepID=A0AC34R0K8_9BILA